MKRKTRKRLLTDKEAAENNKIRKQVEKEFPPTKKENNNAKCKKEAEMDNVRPIAH